MRTLRATEALLEKADRAVLSGEIQQANLLHEKAHKTLLDRQDLLEASPPPLREKAESLREAVQLRKTALTGPEGALRAGLFLAGQEATEDLALFFWDFEKMSVLVLGEATWQSLPAAARERVPTLSKKLLMHFVEHNRTVFENLRIEVHDKAIEDKTARLTCELQYGRTRLAGDVLLVRRDRVWRIFDMRLDMFHFADLLGETFRSVAAVRPLEEALLEDDIYEVLRQASEMAMDDSDMMLSTGGKGMALAMDTVMELDNGETIPMHCSRMVEVLDQSREKHGTRQVRVRALGVVSEDGTEEAAGSTVGWIPEEALPGSVEDEIWTTQ